MKPWLKWTLLALAVLLLCGAAFGLRFYRRINDPGSLFAAATTAAPTPAATAPTAPTPAAPATPTASAAGTPAISPTPDPDASLAAQADADFMQDRVNILALGIDESAERENWGSYRTDTMILISVNFTDNSVALLSIPRDAYVKIYTGKGEPAREDRPLNKVNSAFSAGGGAQKRGFAYSCMTVSKLLDVPVDHYVCVNIPVVKQIVDALGGLWYDVDIDFTMNGRHYAPGYQFMNGQAVMDYCRLRKDSSDLVRADRQQRILTALLQTVRESGSIRSVPAIYAAVRDNVATDLSAEQIAALALLGYRMDMARLSRYTVPVAGITVNGASCLGVKTEALAAMIKEIFGRRQVNIDPEIDIAALAQSTPAPQGTGGKYLIEDGMYFVQDPGANSYRQVSYEEFIRLFPDAVPR